MENKNKLLLFLSGFFIGVLMVFFKGLFKKEIVLEAKRNIVTKTSVEEIAKLNREDIAKKIKEEVKVIHNKEKEQLKEDFFKRFGGEE